MPIIKVEYSVDVETKAETLWEILTNVQSWPEWQGTSYVEPPETDLLKEGSTFVAELGGIKWNLTVIKAERPHKLRWKGRRLGIEAIHDWEFSEEAGKTRVLTWETMSGWVLLLTYPVIKSRLSKYDCKWLADLKSKAESL